ncbi:DUF6602 domain-containing protein [Leptospira mtsangambouensis]|nr:DUF6602 domain-containing protein [Leptospira mtsangambouensis]
MALSEQAVVSHSGLRGSHRELILHHYLQDILPGRFAVSSGIVQGKIGNSAQSDIVIWDSYNYPSLKMQGNRLFFGESVRACIEVKSVFNTREFADIKKKTDLLRIANLGKHFHPTLKEEILSLKQGLHEIRTGTEQNGILISPHRSASVAFSFQGGENFSIAHLTKKELEKVDDQWPDLMIFLAAGKVVYKDFEFVPQEEDRYIQKPFLCQCEFSKDGLLFFTGKLLSLLSERVMNIENYSYFEDYVTDSIQIKEEIKQEYPMHRPFPGALFL